MRVCVFTVRQSGMSEGSHVARRRPAIGASVRASGAGAGYLDPMAWVFASFWCCRASGCRGRSTVPVVAGTPYRMAQHARRPWRHRTRKALRSGTLKIFLARPATPPRVARAAPAGRPQPNASGRARPTRRARYGCRTTGTENRATAVSQTAPDRMKMVTLLLSSKVEGSSTSSAIADPAATINEIVARTSLRLACMGGESCFDRASSARRQRVTCRP